MRYACASVAVHTPPPPLVLHHCHDAALSGGHGVVKKNNEIFLAVNAKSYGRLFHSGLFLSGLFLSHEYEVDTPVLPCKYGVYHETTWLVLLVQAAVCGAVLYGWPAVASLTPPHPPRKIRGGTPFPLAALRRTLRHYALHPRAALPTL